MLVRLNTSFSPAASQQPAFAGSLGGAARLPFPRTEVRMGKKGTEPHVPRGTWREQNPTLYAVRFLEKCAAQVDRTLAHGKNPPERMLGKFVGACQAVLEQFDTANKARLSVVA